MNDKIGFLLGVGAVLGLVALLGYGMRSCDAENARQASAEKDAAWNAPCADTSTLVATTAGSPNAKTCPNKRHKMRVQVATVASGEEAAAVIFCECQR